MASSGWPGRNSSPAKPRADELRARAAGAVHDQHGVAHDALRVLPRRAERAVVDPQLRQRLARGEAEVPDDEVGFRGARRRSPAAAAA